MHVCFGCMYAWSPQPHRGVIIDCLCVSVCAWCIFCVHTCAIAWQMDRSYKRTAQIRILPLGVFVCVYVLYVCACVCLLQKLWLVSCWAVVEKFESLLRHGWTHWDVPVLSAGLDLFLFLYCLLNLLHLQTLTPHLGQRAIAQLPLFQVKFGYYQDLVCDPSCLNLQKKEITLLLAVIKHKMLKECRVKWHLLLLLNFCWFASSGSLPRSLSAVSWVWGCYSTQTNMTPWLLCPSWLYEYQPAPVNLPWLFLPHVENCCVGCF